MGARRERAILADTFDGAGLTGRLSTHSMRKTCAARAYEKLGDIVKVQAVLGHKSISSTQSCLSFADREVEAFFLED